MREHMRLRSRWLTLVLFGVLTSALVAACGSDDANGTQSPTPGSPGGTESPQAGAPGGVWDGRAISESNAELPFVPILINSQRLALGENRLQFAFEWRDGGFVEHADDKAGGEVRIYYLGDGSSEPELVSTETLTERTLDYAAAPPSSPDAEGTSSDSGVSRTVTGENGTHPIAVAPAPLGEHRFTNHDGEHATVFTATVNFDRTDTWGVEVDLEVDGERYENIRVLAHVQERLGEPMVGDPIPASTQPTVADVADIAEIDSSVPPVPELHETTVADALEAGKPMVIAFTTPAFCQTRFCGPIQEQVVVPAWQEYGDQVQFIHIEPYDVPAARQGQLRAAETTLEWGLTMEPIIFIVDADGTVAGKLDGIAEYEELAAAIDALLASS